MVYIDNEYKCHTTNPQGAYREIEKNPFPTMCKTWIEGMIYVPEGESCTIDGVEYHGEMHAPWKPSSELEIAQEQYETDMAQLQTAYQEGVNSV